MRTLALLLPGLLLVAPALADLPKESDVPPLIRKLSGQAPAKVRAEAAKEIGEIGMVKASYAKPAIPTLMKAAAQDKDPGVRRAALVALGQVDPDPKEAMPVFLDALKDKSDDVRSGAARGLGYLGGDGREALPELRKINEELRQLEMKDNAKDKDKKAKKMMLSPAKRQLQQSVRDAMRAVQGEPRHKK